MGDDTEYVLTGRLDQARRGVVAGAVTDRWCRCAEPVVLSPQYAGRTAICTVCIDRQRPTFPAEILEYEADGEGFRIGEHRWFRGVLSAGPSPTNRVADKTPIPWAEGTGSVPLLKEDQQVDRHARLFRRLLKSRKPISYETGRPFAVLVWLEDGKTATTLCWRELAGQ